MPTMVIFVLDQQRFALPLDCVERAVRMVEVTPLPQAPAIVCGVVNVQGRIVPVINLRRRFGLAERKTVLSDQLLIARSTRRTLAMSVDAVSGVAECSDCVAGAAIVPGIGYVKGIVKLADGLVLIHDLDTFLALDEAQSLEQALVAATGGEMS
ncbi:MAG TPA: chemotaxis protein CheW [Rhodocyclaceae bacterium]|nr:chemotaxis protein CheW [Rhodocyclaceae bacterium]